MGITRTTLVVIALLTQTWSVPAAAKPASAGMPEYRDGELLVRFRSSSNQRARDTAHRRIGARVARRFGSVDGLQHVRLPDGLDVQDAVGRYLDDPSVMYAEPNYVVRAEAVPDDEGFGWLWGMHNVGNEGGLPDADIDAPEAWEIETGDASVVVAVIDTGVDHLHEDLVGNRWSNPGECNSNGLDDDGNGYIDDCHGVDAANDDSDPIDDNGHGTHVAGTIGATGNNGIGVAGVVHDVSILACKFLNNRGSGLTSDALECFDYVLAEKLAGTNVVAVNNSWGSAARSEAVAEAIAAHRQAGILNVFSAGNFGVDAELYPASVDDPGIVSVAATTRTDELAEFSSRGRSVHLGAPGQHVYSTVPGTYGTLSGTSMAAPHVTGAAALLAAHDPSLSWSELRNLLMATGDPLPVLDQTVSGRRLNVHRALTCSGVELMGRTRPASDSVALGVSVPLRLAAVHVDCSQPAGDVEVTVMPGNATVTLLDDGTGVDQAAGDGVYSAQWSSPVTGSFLLSFPGGDSVDVEVRSDVYVLSTSSVFSGFGEAMAADGNHLLVGAPRDDTAGSNAGAAYLFDVTTGQLLHAFYSPDPQPGDLMGENVALSGGRALIGAALADAIAEDQGAAYLYDTASGDLLHTFSNPSPHTGDEFGWSVALLEEAALVGSYLDDTPVEDAGRAFVFGYDSGELLTTIVDDDPAVDEGFAYRVAAVDGGAAIVVPADQEPKSGIRLGFVKHYDLDRDSPGFGTHAHTFPISPGAQGTFIAGSDHVAGSGDRIIASNRIGILDLREQTGDAAEFVGVVTSYSVASGEMRGTLDTPAPENSADFGFSIAAHDRWAVAGAPETSREILLAGAAYLFDADTGDLRRVLASPKPEIADVLGSAVAVTATRAFAAASRDDTVQVDAGAVYAFEVPPVRGALKCYGASGQKAGAPAVAVTDAFSAYAMTATVPASYCTATARENFLDADVDRHAVCYKAKAADAAPAFTPQVIEYADTHGRRSVVVQKPTTLCMPASTGAPASPLIDPYTCYRMKAAPGAERFLSRKWHLTDDLEEKDFETLKPDAFCSSAALDGNPPGSAADHLACYRVRQSRGQLKFAGATIATDDDLAAQTLALKKVTTLCFPATLLQN